MRYKNQILEKICINHTIQSFSEYLIQATNTVCCQFFLSWNSIKSLYDWFAVYLSKQPFHVGLLENGISASCHLMFSSDHSPRSVSWQVLNKQLGGSLWTGLGVIMLCNCGSGLVSQLRLEMPNHFLFPNPNRKILTSDTGSPPLQLLWGTLEVPLKDSLFMVPGALTQCTILNQHTGEYRKWFQLSHVITLQVILPKLCSLGHLELGLSSGMDLLLHAL